MEVATLETIAGTPAPGRAPSRARRFGHVLRKTVFWVHLVVGLLGGGVLAVLAGTGALLAYAPQIIEWADRGALRVTVPEGAVRRPLGELIGAAQNEAKGGMPRAVTVARSPDRVVVVNYGRGITVYVDPYTGQVRLGDSKDSRSFFRTVTGLHRNLALGLNGGIAVRVATVGLAALCVSGLWLWWPRSWRPQSLRAVLLPRLANAGRTRDWNWHNVAGLWSLPFVAAMTWSGLVLSFEGLGRWLNSANAVPAAIAAGTAVPKGGSASPDRLLAAALEAAPDWESATLRMGGRGGRGGQGGRRRAGVGQSGAPAPAIVSVQEVGLFSLLPTEVQLHPATAEVLAVRRVGDLSVREFFARGNILLHRGDILGVVGQAFNVVGCFAVLMLVYTGYALSWRRFSPRRGRGATGGTRR